MCGLALATTPLGGVPSAGVQTHAVSTRLRDAIVRRRPRRSSPIPRTAAGRLEGDPTRLMLNPDAKDARGRARRPHSGDRLCRGGSGLLRRFRPAGGDGPPERGRCGLAAEHQERQALRGAARRRRQLRGDRPRRTAARLPRQRNRAHRLRDQGDVPDGLPAPALGPSSASPPSRAKAAVSHDPSLGQRSGHEGQGHRRPRRDRALGPGCPRAGLHLQRDLGAQQDERARSSALHVPPPALHPEAPPAIRPQAALRHRPIPTLGPSPR